MSITTNQPDKLSVDQVAELLGCSAATVRRLTRSGQLHPLRYARKHWYLSTEVKALIDAQTTKGTR